MRIVANARVAAFAMGGQQRVTIEILRRLQGVTSIAPDHALNGVQGHLWEQTVLPWRARGALLWSPSATGPVLHRRQVVTLHDVAFLDVPEFFAPRFLALYRTLMPVLTRRAARIVTVSEFSRRRISATLGVPLERIAVVANGVSAQFRRYSTDEIAATRAALDLPSRYVLLQATSDRRKNLAGSLRAWSQVCGFLPEDVQLVVSGHLGRAHVFGDGPGTIAAPRTRPIGFVAEEHLAPLIAGAEAFLFPSFYEGFGLPIVEAMACGTPVLTSDATATAEVAGDCAILVDPTSTASIGSGLRRLYAEEGLRQRLTGSGLLHAARYSWDDAARAYENIFADVATQTI
jgi:glycosyltransferase involved in cell wall biosynthesis